MQQMQADMEAERSNRDKLQADMDKLRAFYDSKLQSVDGQLANLPPTSEGEKPFGGWFVFIFEYWWGLLFVGYVITQEQSLSVEQICLENFEGSRPEWCISSMMYK